MHGAIFLSLWGWQVRLSACNTVLMALLEVESWLLISSAMSLEKIRNLMFHFGFSLLNMNIWDFSKNGKGYKNQTTSQFPFKIKLRLYQQQGHNSKQVTMTFGFTFKGNCNHWCSCELYPKRNWKSKIKFLLSFLKPNYWTILLELGVALLLV